MLDLIKNEEMVIETKDETSPLLAQYSKKTWSFCLREMLDDKKISNLKTFIG